MSAGIRGRVGAFVLRWESRGCLNAKPHLHPLLLDQAPQAPPGTVLKAGGLG